MTSADGFNALAAATIASSLAIGIVLAVRVPLRRWLGAQAAYLCWLLVPVAVFATRLPAPRVASGHRSNPCARLERS